MTVRDKARKLLNIAAILAAACTSAPSQCAMCRAAVGNSAEASSIAGSMNLAVMALIIPPVALFCSFIVLLYRHRKAPGEFAASAHDQEAAVAAAEQRRRDRQNDADERARSKGDGDRPRALAKAT